MISSILYGILLLPLLHLFARCVSSVVVIASCYGKIIRKDCGRTLEQDSLLRHQTTFTYLVFIFISFVYKLKLCVLSSQYISYIHYRGSVVLRVSYKGGWLVSGWSANHQTSKIVCF